MISDKQKIFNEKKWFDSIRYGKDMCGEYDFCCKCDKSLENPCEKAQEKYTKLNKTTRIKAKAKFKVDDKERVFRSTIMDKFQQVK